MAYPPYQIGYVKDSNTTEINRVVKEINRALVNVYSREPIQITSASSSVDKVTAYQGEIYSNLTAAKVINLPAFTESLPQSTQEAVHADVADEAVKLQTMRTINSTPFDGTSSIIIYDDTKSTLSGPGNTYGFLVGKLEATSGASTSGAVTAGLTVKGARGLLAGNSENSDTSTLDWYEENTIALYLADESSGGNISATTATAKFTRIGNIVHIQATFSAVSTSGMTASNPMFIHGLPYTVNGYAQGCVRFDHVGGGAAQGNGFLAYSTVGHFEAYSGDSGQSPIQILVGHFVSGVSTIIINLTYLI